MDQKKPLSSTQRQLVNKRLTLNLIIQGAATHAFWTAHHLVAAELDEVDPCLIPLYEKILLHGNLGYWVGGIPLLAGKPKRFWKRVAKGNTEHAFAKHPFFQKFGLQAATESKNELFQMCRDAGLATGGLRNEFGACRSILEITEREAEHQTQLEQIAVSACHQIYDIPIEVLRAELTATPKWGDVREPDSTKGRMLLALMVGWGGVDREDGRLVVQAKAVIWPLLLHELVKGTVELIALHGLGDLPDEQYETVIEHTDHLEFEFPMIQIGRYVFRKFLAAKPMEIPLSKCIMHIARFEPDELESLMSQLIESPNRATDAIRAADRQSQR